MGTLASAIAQLENTNPIYNNPGAISGTGDTGASFGAGIGIYSTLQAGKSALENQLTKIYSGKSAYYTPSMSLDQFGQVYAPNQNYGASLASILKVPSSTPISAIPSGVGSIPTMKDGQLVVGGKSYSVDQLSQIGTDLAVGKGSGGITDWLNSKEHDFVVILVGVILVAAGVFAFKQTQTVIETGTRLGKKAAAFIA